MEETFSLQEIAKIIKKRLWLIIILTVTSIGIAAGISYYVLTPVYQAQTQILVNQNNDTNEAYSWESTQIDLGLINTYNGIITSPVILEPVIEKLELEVTPKMLMTQISVSNESNSKIVTISVLDSSSVQAVEISNTVAEVFKEQIPKLLSVDNITILSAAKLSDAPSPIKPNKMKNMAVAAVIGLLLGVGLALVLEFLDTTIKSERDIEEILGLPVIGVVGLIAVERKKRSSLISRRARRSQNV